MATVSTRESMILSLETHSGKTRTLNLPAPRPSLDADAVRLSVGRIIAANVFEEGEGTGRPVGLRRAAREVVTTKVLFS